MKNDYSKDYFWIKEDGLGVKHYYFKINGKYHEVENKVFNVCHNSYMKQIRDNQKDIDLGLISLDGDDNFNNPLVNSLSINDDVIGMLNLNDKVKEVINEINKLDIKDRELITNLLIEEKTERELAKQLNVSQVAIHKRKTKIIKKIRNNLEK